MFYTPENFIQQAKNLGKGLVDQFGLGKIFLRNDIKYLYGIFYSEDSDENFKEKVKGFSQAFGLHVFEVRKDGTLNQVYKTSRAFW